MGRLTLELLLRGAILLVVARVHPFSYDVHRYWARMHTASLTHLPYRDFGWEFPPLTLLVVLPARWLSVHAFTAVFVGEMLCAEYGSLCLLRRRFPHDANAISWYWSCVVLPLAAQTWFRLDFLSVLLATWAVLRILARRSAAVPITLGVLAKLWPAVLIVVLAAKHRIRRAAVATAAVAASVAAWFAFSPSGFDAFVRYRHGSGLQIESLVGAPLFAAGASVSSASDSYVVHRGSLGWVDPVLLGMFCVLVLICLLSARDRPVRVVSLGGGLVVALMLLSRILSPQYLVWAAPFAALAWASGQRVAALLFAVAAWLTAILNFEYAAFVRGDGVMQALVLTRNLLLVGVALALLRHAFAPGAADEEAVCAS